MARKGPQRGLKRSKAPKHWRIARKENKWTIKPHPGPHNKEAIPLAFILRDNLGYAHTLQEAKQILNERKVMINGKVRTDFKFPVGIMDVVEIPAIHQFYRLLPDRKGIFILHPIADTETHLRPLKITGKCTVKGERTQLHFHDGSTLLIPENGGKPKKGKMKGKEKEKRKEKGKTEEEREKEKKVLHTKLEAKMEIGKQRSYSTFGTVMYDFSSHRITDYIPLSKGSVVLVTGGRNVSRTGKITAITDSMVEISGEELFRTLKDHVFVIGAEESVISLPGD